MQGEIKGDKLILTIDISKEARQAAGPSSSGKSLVVDTSRGFTHFGDIAVSLNATIPLPAGYKFPEGWVAKPAKAK
jgi:hypothetical protein